MGRIQKAISSIFNHKKELGVIKQKDLAEALGVSQPSVSNYLSGVTPLTDGQIEAICDVLGITLGDLDRAIPATQEVSGPREIREYSAKMQILYDMPSFPAFKSVARTIDDWVKAGNLLKPQIAKQASKNIN
jgi:transcriptional regulator with XRE-family HTH domain